MPFIIRTQEILRLFFSRQYTVKRAAILLAVAGLLSNVLGLLRNLVFSRFSTPGALDIYRSSFIVPDLIFNVLILGAISTAFIPVLACVIERKKKAPEETISPWQVTNQVISWLTLFLGGLAVLLAVFMNPIIHYLVAPGFSPDRLAEAVFLSRLILLQSLFFAWSFTIGGLLNSYGRFSSFALAPLLYNLSLIGGGIVAGRYGIRAIVVSVIVGAFLHLAIQYSEVRKLGYRPQFDFGRSPELKEILRTMVPRGLTQGVGSIVAIVYNNLGSSLILGSIMVFNFMNDLQTTPTVVIANSMAIAFFPSISAKLNTDDKEGANVLLDKVIRASLFLLIPCVAILFILRAQVVRLYIGIGGADWTLTYLAINSLVWFLVGIIPASLSTILGRVFYALKEVRLPLILGAISGLAGILVALVGIKVFHGDATVLAAAVSVAAWAQLILYIFALRRYGYFKVNFRWLTQTISRSLGASVLMVAATWLTLQIVNYFYEATKFSSTHLVWGLLLQLILATAAGLLVYLGYAKKTHPEEWRWVKESVSSRLR